jgi:hypothetical protein
MKKYKVTGLPKAQDGKNLKRFKKRKYNVGVKRLRRRRSAEDLFTEEPATVEPQYDSEGYTMYDPQYTPEMMAVSSLLNPGQPRHHLLLNDDGSIRTPEEEAAAFNPDVSNWGYGTTIPEETITVERPNILKYMMESELNPYGYKDGFSRATRQQLGMYDDGLEMNQYDLNTPEQFMPDYHAPYTATGEDLNCPQGFVAYKGQCVTERAYAIIRDREMQQESDEHKQEMLERYTASQERHDKWLQDRHVKKQLKKHEDFSKSKKHDKIEPFQAFPSTFITEDGVEMTMEEEMNREIPKYNLQTGEQIFDDNGNPIMTTPIENFKEGHYIQKNKDGTYSLWPREWVMQRIIWNGFRADAFKKDWGVDPKQIEEQFGKEMKIAQQMYDDGIKKEIIEEALKTGHGIGETIWDLYPEKGSKGYRKEIEKRFQEPVEDLVTEAYNKFLKEKYPEIENSGYLYNWGQDGRPTNIYGTGIDTYVTDRNNYLKRFESQASPDELDYAHNVLGRGLVYNVTPGEFDDDPGYQEYLKNRSTPLTAFAKSAPVPKTIFNWADVGGKIKDGDATLYSPILNPEEKYLEHWISQGDQNPVWIDKTVNGETIKVDNSKYAQDRRKKVEAIENKKYPDARKEAIEKEKKKQAELKASNSAFAEMFVNKDDTDYSVDLQGDPPVSDQFSNYQNYYNQEDTYDGFRSLSSGKKQTEKEYYDEIGNIGEEMARLEELNELTGIQNDRTKFMSDINAGSINETITDMMRDTSLDVDDKINILSQYSKGIHPLQMTQYNPFALEDDEPVSLLGMGYGNDDIYNTYKDRLGYLLGLDGEGYYNMVDSWRNADRIQAVDPNRESPLSGQPTGWDKLWDYVTNPNQALWFALSPHSMHPEGMTGTFNEWDEFARTHGELDPRTGEKTMFENPYTAENQSGNSMAMLNPINFAVSLVDDLNPLHMIDEVSRSDDKWGRTGDMLWNAGFDAANFMTMGGLGLMDDVVKYGSKLKPLQKLMNIPGHLSKLGAPGKVAGQWLRNYGTAATVPAVYDVLSGEAWGRMKENYEQGNYGLLALDAGLTVPWAASMGLRNIGRGPRFINYTTPGGKTFGLGPRTPQFSTISNRGQFQDLSKAGILSSLRKSSIDPAKLEAIEQGFMQGRFTPTIKYTHPSRVGRRLAGLPATEQSIMENIAFRPTSSGIEMGTFNNPWRAKSKFGELQLGPNRFYPINVTGYSMPHFNRVMPRNMGLPYREDGGVVTKLNQNEIDQYVKDGYVIEDV